MNKSRKRMSIFTRVMCFVLASLMLLGTFGTLVFGADIRYTDKDGKTIKLTDFRDTKGHWGQSTILKWAEYEIVNGYNGNFMPNQPMKRGDLAVVLDRMLGLTTMSYNFFNDLPNDAYYRDAMLRNVAAGYFTGTSANTVNPLGNTTREEIAVILCRVFKIDTSNAGRTHFVDDSQIAYWAKPSISALSKLGYMNGDGKRVNPKGNVTRAEIITLFDNIAEVYIPRRDTNNQGTSFSLEANRNLVTSRNIALVRSIIGRDLITTEATKSLDVQYSTIKGRVLVLGKTNINFNNSSVKRVELYNKSTVRGITTDIEEIYIAEYATESTLDRIPEKVILEPGVRVRIDSIMYENDSTKTKTYYGLDIKADIAAEQGYVMGGPRITGAKATHTYDNNLVFKEVKINLGEADIDEIGVIYTDKEGEIPSLSNYTNKVKYTRSYTAPFDINMGRIYGERTYRVYAIDDNGLISYSTPVTFKAYSFDFELEIFDLNYPETIRAEVLFNGSNIPEISNVKVIHNTTSIYEEDVRLINLSQAKVEEDERAKGTLYRYSGQVKSDFETVNGEKVFYPPTEFGYSITFRDGSVVQTFPVLTNAAPKDIAPVDTITTGNARFTDNRIDVVNNYIRTRHIQIQEAGVIYREVPKGTSLQVPEAGINGWKTQSSYVNVGLKDSVNYSAKITTSSIDNETHYAAYVRTANGYYYGSVKRVQNDWVGTENGPKITGTPEVLVLDETKVLVTIPVDLRNGLDSNAESSIISFTDKDGNPVYQYNNRPLTAAKVYTERNQTLLIIIFENLQANQVYESNLRLFNNKGESSNVVSMTINTKDLMPITINKKSLLNNELIYDMYMPTLNNGYNIESRGVTVYNSSANAYISTSSKPWQLTIRSLDIESTTIEVGYKFYIVKGIGNIKSEDFTRTFTIQK